MQRSTTLTLLAALAAGSTASAQIAFRPPFTLAAAQTPDALAIADLNGDGKQDLAIATDAPDRLVLRFGNGDGTFGATVNVLLGNGTSPHTPVAGDFDHDGDLDLAVSLKNVDTVRILRNNGLGSFTLLANVSTGADPRDMALGDVDGDLDLDLAVSNRDGSSVSVLRNNGSASFSVATYVTALEPREIALGDFTGDGRLDIAVSAHGARQVTILRNQGTGTFAPFANLPMPGNIRPDGIAAADLNGNGTIDVATSGSTNGVDFVTVFANAGGGAFSGGTSFAVNGVDASGLVAADFDLDGDSDLATANLGTDNVSILANNGHGAFGTPLVIAVGSEPGHLAVGKLDQNGSIDLVASNDLSSNVSVLLNSDTSTGCSVASFCQGKTNSAGHVAAIGSRGTPRVGGSFAVTVSGALAGNPGVLFSGVNGRASIPFQGGTLCIAPPRTRLGVRAFDASGGVSYPISVDASFAGTMRWFQDWYRDPAIADGTGTALSNALEVTFCP